MKRKNYKSSINYNNRRFKINKVNMKIKFKTKKDKSKN